MQENGSGTKHFNSKRHGRFLVPPKPTRRRESAPFSTKRAVGHSICQQQSPSDQCQPSAGLLSSKKEREYYLGNYSGT